MKKTIFRLTYAGLLIAAFLACGAVASFAQDPCTDVASLNAKQDEFDTLYKKGPADLDARQKAIDSGKEFVEKYGNCDSAKERVDWLKSKIPGFEADLKKRRERGVRDAVINPFNAALDATGSADAAAKAKGYADAMSYGQQMMTKWPEDYRAVEIVLATIGGDDALIRNNYKNADDTLRFAKMAIADLEANKSFVIENTLGGSGQPLYGLSKADQATKKVLYNYAFENRNAALGWMNIYVGNILFNNKKDHAGALPYLYKATKYVPDNPASYAMIGDYYTEQLAPAVTEINDLIQKGKGLNNADEIKANNELIKSKIAMSNGIAERAMDAYARAYSIPGTKAEYKTNIKARIDAIFKVRFPTPTTTVDQWITTAVAKPFIDPATPIAPIADPETPKTTTGEATTTTAPATTGTSTKPVVTTPAKTQAPAKTTGTSAKKPGTAAVKSKTVAKKRGA